MTFLYEHPDVESVGSLVLCTALLLLAFAALAIVCDDYLCPAIEVICERFRIPDEVAGATLLAFGSSAPEVMLSAVGTAHGKVQMSLSAIIGSALIAFGLIPAICALQTGEMKLKLWPLLRDTGFYMLSLLMLVRFIEDRDLGVGDSSSLCALFVVYVAVVTVPVYFPMSGALATDVEEAAPINSSSSASAVERRRSRLSSIDDVADITAVIEAAGAPDAPQEVPPTGFARAWAAVTTPIEGLLKLTIPNCSEEDEGGNPDRYWWTFLASMVWVCLLSDASLQLCSAIAGDLHLPHSVAGATILALGAQIPDTICSVAMARSGFADGAVSNAIGSQVINVSLGAGLPPLVYALVHGSSVQLGTQRNVTLAAYCLLAVIVAYLTATLTFRRAGHIAGLTPSSGLFLLGVWFLATLMFVGQADCVWGAQC